MKLSPVHAIFWSSFLVLWTHRSTQSGCKAPDSDLCQDKDLDDPRVQRYNSSGHLQPDDEEGEEEEDEEDGNFSCLLYPTKTLNCSWSFPSVQKDSQFSAFLVICEGKTRIGNVSADGVGLKSVVLGSDCIDYDQKLFAILRVNVSLPDGWTIYTHKYHTKRLEVLSPPPNITALFSDEGLMVTWGRTHGTQLSCLDYQLGISSQGQERLINCTNCNKLNHTERNADPTHTYRVRMRMRKSHDCVGSPHWSDWSHIVTVEPTKSPYELNYAVIITISLGIPMILLAMLLVRHQRVYEILFPPIPQPSSKYKYFLERSDTFIVSRPVQPPKYVEEIMEVEEAEQSPR